MNLPNHRVVEVLLNHCLVDGSDYQCSIVFLFAFLDVLNEYQTNYWDSPDSPPGFLCSMVFVSERGFNKSGKLRKGKHGRSSSGHLSN